MCQRQVAYLGECPWEDDWAFAQAVCQQANVPLEAVPLQKEYWDRVCTPSTARTFLRHPVRYVYKDVCV